MASNTKTQLFRQQPTLVDVVDSGDSFSVHRIYCVGQNYRKHVVEMGGNPDRESPFFFSKPADAITQNSEVQFPGETENLHHEVECVIALQSGGENISVDEAESHIFGYALGVDLTRRDLQATAKDKGRPWDVAKGFDQSAPISAITPVSHAGLISESEISLAVNGDIKQTGNLQQMIWSIPELVAELSKYYCLRAGDLIFTGTPDGVGPLQPGDRVECQLGNLLTLEFRMSV